MNIIRVQTEEHVQEIRMLFREYETFLGVDLCFQNFEQEVADLPGEYAAPDGLLLLAVERQQVAGCGALRRLDEGVCEMKRLFVRPEFRGLGLGKALAKNLVATAVRLGYSTMLLDTLQELDAAIVLYESLGFVRTAPYYNNPLPGVVYWKLDLSKTEGQSGATPNGGTTMAVANSDGAEGPPSVSGS